MLDKYVLHGNRRHSPAEVFEEMAVWCRGENITHDIYGNGEAIEHLENKVAKLLGFEASLFVITGTMAQATALQLACEKRNVKNVGVHASATFILERVKGISFKIDLT